MKNFLKVFIAAAGLVLFFNVSSFASIDLAAWGGYAFTGTTQTNSGVKGKKIDITGIGFGFKGHYNIEFSPLFDLGLGIFFQNVSLENEYDAPATRKAAGLDVAFIINEIPLPALHLYARGTLSIYDKVKSDDGSTSGTGLGCGGGLEYSITPSVRLFGEYMYEFAGYDDEEGTTMDLNTSTINLGLKFVF